MSPSLKLYVAQRLFRLGERAVRNASRTERDEVIAQLQQAVQRLDEHRTS